MRLYNILENMASDVKTLLTKVNDILAYNNANLKDNTNWNIITLTNGSKYAFCGYRKIGTNVELVMAVTSLATYSQKTLFTLPQGFRPYANFYLVGNANALQYISSVSIKADGTVNAITPTGDCFFQIIFTAGN